MVAPGGTLLVTVPAYQWLWSGHDEINHHHRRYTRRSLQRVGEQAGWQQVRTTYFNSLLLPAAILLRVLDRFSRKTTESSLDLWVPPAAAQLAARAPAGARGRADRPRRADPRGALAARRVPLSRPRRYYKAPLEPLGATRAPRDDAPRQQIGVGGDGRGGCMRNVQARLTRNVITVTIAVAQRLAEQLLDAGAVDEQVQQALVEREPAALHDAPAHRRQRVADVPANVQRRLSRKPLMAPTTKPIADAARYQTPNTFSSTV